MLKRTNFSFSIARGSQKSLREFSQYLNMLKHDLLAAEKEIEIQDLKLANIERGQLKDIEKASQSYQLAKNNIQELERSIFDV